MKQILILILYLSFGLISVFGKDFESGSTVDQTREQISKLPKDDIIKATVTCTDIAGDLPWEMEEDRGSFVIRYRGVVEIEE